MGQDTRQARYRKVGGDHLHLRKSPGDKAYSFQNDRSYSWLSLAGMKEVRSYIVPGVSPAISIMGLAAGKVVDKVKKFTQ
jgi:hypothetical protein